MSTEYSQIIWPDAMRSWGGGGASLTFRVLYPGCPHYLISKFERKKDCNLQTIKKSFVEDQRLDRNPNGAFGLQNEHNAP
jgi:hypothetical protein